VISWTASERDTVVDAVRHAPGLHNNRPWALEFGEGRVSLVERQEIPLPRHDPAGRERLITCGAALTNLRLAVRNLGWGVNWSEFPEPDRPDEVARVSTTIPSEPDDAEQARYWAVWHRRSHTNRFGPDPVPDLMVRALTYVPSIAGVDVRVVGPAAEAATVTDLLGYAARAARDNPADQRELRAWTGVGLTPMDAGASMTRLVVTTIGDGRGDYLLAGAALEEIWLAAVHAGLVASALIQPLRLFGVRSLLAQRLNLAGYPQALLRIGYPAAVRSSARPVRDDAKPRC
jgi:hypothetical protein